MKKNHYHLTIPAGSSKEHPQCVVPGSSAMVTTVLAVQGRDGLAVAERVPGGAKPGEGVGNPEKKTTTSALNK